MIKFNLNYLISYSDNNPDKIVENVKKLTRNKGIKSITKDSFIINPESLLKDTTMDNYSKAIYIILCGRRSYSKYTTEKIKYLNTYESTFPLENVSKVDGINIIDDKIYFKYEEN